MTKIYPTDSTDDQWALLAPLLPAAKRGGRPRTADLRLVLNTIFSLSKAVQSIGLYESSDTLAASVAEGRDAQPVIVTASNKTQMNQILERIMRHPFVEVIAIVWVGLLCAGCAPDP